MKRIDGRSPEQMREIKIEPGVLRHAEGSAMIEIGATKVICSATLQDRVPPHVVGTGRGWLTAEYAMLPRCSAQRIVRDGVRGTVAPRSTEIQRIVGRVLRSVFNLDKLGERTIIIDCDVIEADGGTRTASITGGFVALSLAVRNLRAHNKIAAGLILDFAAATSVGIVEGQPVLDLCYLEDAQAEVDMNVSASGSGRFIEIQSTAERTPFAREHLDRMLDLAQSGIAQLVVAQKAVLGVDSFA